MTSINTSVNNVGASAFAGSIVVHVLVRSPRAMGDTTKSPSGIVLGDGGRSVDLSVLLDVLDLLMLA